MGAWNSETGLYQIPPVSLDLKMDIPADAPDVWLSKPGGNYFLGLSFHFLAYNFPKGNGIIEKRFRYSVAPYHLRFVQDPYNSWAVSACLSKFTNIGPMECWDWLPGIQIVDTSLTYSLPDSKLAAYAGTEWADNDYRIFCGLYDRKICDTLIQKTLELINRLMGPGWAGWPFGHRQLTESVITWVNCDTMMPELLLLASTRQSGAKHSYWNKRLYNPGDELGGWENKPDNTWDCRHALRFLYQAKILLKDGLPEMAVSAAIASLENAAAELLVFLLAGDVRKVKKELASNRFLDRFDKLLPKYGAKLPNDMFLALKQAYFVRNDIVHGLLPISDELAHFHIITVENILVWYWENVGEASSDRKVK